MSSHKPVLAVDLDSVLAEIMEPLITYHNNHYYTNTRFQEHYTYDLAVMWHCTSEQVIDRVLDFYQTPAMDTVVPIEGSVRAVHELSNQFEIHIITARPSKIIDKTTQWVETHYGTAITAIHTTDIVSKEQSKRRSKSTVCKDINATVAVDDAVEYAEDIATIPIPVLLFDMPWNRNYPEAPYISRVKSWNEITKKLT